MIDLVKQWTLTKDNIMVQLDCVVYYRVTVPREAIYSVNDINLAVTELALSTVRAIVGHYTLQEVLEKRAEVAAEIEKFVERHVFDWGIEIDSCQFKDIILS